MGSIERWHWPAQRTVQFSARREPFALLPRPEGTGESTRKRSSRYRPGSGYLEMLAIVPAEPHPILRVDFFRLPDAATANTRSTSAHWPSFRVRQETR